MLWKFRKMILLFNGKGENGLGYKGKLEALSNVSQFNCFETIDGICYGIGLITSKFLV